MVVNQANDLKLSFSLTLLTMNINFIGVNLPLSSVYLDLNYLVFRFKAEDLAVYQTKIMVQS